MSNKADIRVMIVDDDSYAKHITQHHLKRLGLENIVEASDGAVALKILETEKIDLIITDWYMPALSGLELFQAVREKEDLKTIPFLMITVEADQVKIQEARDLGIAECLTKPIVAENFEKKIKALLNLS